MSRVLVFSCFFSLKLKNFLSQGFQMFLIYAPFYFVQELEGFEYNDKPCIYVSSMLNFSYFTKETKILLIILLL
jgi:hypothetical protein